VEFDAGARVAGRSEIVLTVESLDAVETPRGPADVVTEVTFARSGEGALSGALKPAAPVQAARWHGSGRCHDLITFDRRSFGTRVDDQFEAMLATSNRVESETLPFASAPSERHRRDHHGAVSAVSPASSRPLALTSRITFRWTMEHAFKRLYMTETNLNVGGYIFEGEG